MEQSLARKAVADFLAAHRKAVLATVGDDEHPTTSLMLYAADDQFNVYFGTRKSFAKYRIFERHPYASLSVVEESVDPLRTVEIRGKIAFVPEKETAERLHWFTSKNPSEYSIILPVHLMGYPCDMEKINNIAKKYGLITFEDSAQAHGSLLNGKKTGSLSLLSDFSFYLAHNIQAGEMGAINTDDFEIKRLLKKIKANGRMCECEVCRRAEGLCPKLDMGQEEDFDPRFTHDMIGFNFKTMEFQAVLGLVNLKKVDEILKKRAENVKYLNEGLKKFDGILQLPRYSTSISYLAYPITIKDSMRISRKKIRAELEKRGIETRPLFGCIPTQQPAYSHLKETYTGKLPNAEYIGLNSFYIGCHQFLTRDQLDHVIKSFNEILEGV